LVDTRTDLWAVGATLFALLTGRYVHEAETANEQLLAAMIKPAAPLASVLADIPAPVATVVDRALAYDSNERWSDARAMRAAVQEAYEAVTEKPVALASRLETSETSTLEVVHAPTLRVMYAPSSKLEAMSVAATIAWISGSWRGRLAKLAFLVATLAVLGTVALVSFRRTALPANVAPTTAVPSDGLGFAPAATSSATPSLAPSLANSPTEPVASTPSASATSASPAVRASPRKSRLSPAPSSSASVDLYSRRK
jgi:serine/threonine-protein kinase